ncbi:hypothetical protein PMAC_003120 [Pneumocystis sp. 'macacae']|nr:hypothetical protein PMAC_003120 [Pneumocystis sp. 'macacae']
MLGAVEADDNAGLVVQEGGWAACRAVCGVDGCTAGADGVWRGRGSRCVWGWVAEEESEGMWGGMEVAGEWGERVWAALVRLEGGADMCGGEGEVEYDVERDEVVETGGSGESEGSEDGPVVWRGDALEVLGVGTVY